MKNYVLTATLLLMSVSTLMAQVELKTEAEKKKFSNKNFEFSMSHKANAGQTRNTKMTGAIIDNPDVYKGVRKIAILGVTVAFTSRDGSGSKGDNGYAGIPVDQFDELADSILFSIYRGLESEGFQVISLDKVMKAPSYSKVNFGSCDDASDNSWVTSPIKSKCFIPESMNSIKSGISFVHADTLKARAFKRNSPLQKLAAEAGADAGVIIAVRFFIYGNEFKMGWGSLKRGLVIDMIPASGDPRIVWSVTLKSDVDLDIKIGTYDKKSGLYEKSWKYNLRPSIPRLSEATYYISGAAGYQLKNDQSGK